DLFAERLLSPAQGPADGGPMSVRPGGLPDDPAKMAVAGLCDGTPADLPATGVLARDRAAVTHQLSRAAEAGQLADFSDDRHGRDLGDAAKGLQGCDDRTHPFRGCFHGLIDRSL